MNATMKAVAVILLVAIDQATKWATEAFLPWQQDMEFVPFIALFRTYNTGVAFSMFDGAPSWTLAALTVVIVAVVLVLWWRTPPGKPLAQIGFALIVSGAVGNVIDRVSHGYVIDMIRVHTETWSFAIFNVADSYISVGAAAIILDEVLSMRKHSPKPKQDSTP